MLTVPSQKASVILWLRYQRGIPLHHLSQHIFQSENNAVHSAGGCKVLDRIAISRLMIQTHAHGCYIQSRHLFGHFQGQKKDTEEGEEQLDTANEIAQVTSEVGLAKTPLQQLHKNTTRRFGSLNI